MLEQITAQLDDNDLIFYLKKSNFKYTKGFDEFIT